jgi:hypothetical protein
MPAGYHWIALPTSSLQDPASQVITCPPGAYVTAITTYESSHYYDYGPVDYIGAFEP